MKTLANTTNISSTSHLNVHDGPPNLAGATIQKHENLLSRIISGFGFNEIEARAILTEVFNQASKEFGKYSGALTFKLWLSKLLVRKCIFKISVDYFSGLQNATLPPQGMPRLSGAASIFVSGDERIPISFWSVYLLNHHIGFTVTEIAEILNSNPLNVRERLSKALKFIAKT